MKLKLFHHDLAEKMVMIVGAGNMGEVRVRHQAMQGARSALVSNRSFRRAQGLVVKFGGRSIRLR